MRRKAIVYEEATEEWRAGLTGAVAPHKYIYEGGVLFRRVPGYEEREVEEPVPDWIVRAVASKGGLANGSLWLAEHARHIHRAYLEAKERGEA